MDLDSIAPNFKGGNAENEEKLQKIKEQKKFCLSNMSLCHFQLKEYKEAIEFDKQVIN